MDRIKHRPEFANSRKWRFWGLKKCISCRLIEYGYKLVMSC